MTEAQQFEFKKWYLVASGTEKSYTRYELADLAWQHQQQRIDELEAENSELKFQCASNDLHADTLLDRIDELESKIKIAVDALEAGEKLIDDISLFLIAAGVPKSKINYDNDSLLKKALKKIEVK